MKKYSDKRINIKGFTILELTIVITIIAILGAYSFDFYKGYKQEQIVDDEISDIQHYGLLLINIINKNGDIPLNYCKNAVGTYDSDCFEPDPLLDGTTDNICNGIDGDFLSDNDCDTNCVIINCEENTCLGNNIFYDFDKLIENEVNYNTIFRTDTFKDKLSYRLCPEKDSTDSTVIGKGYESEFETFNPSFSLYYRGRSVFKYNSNP